MFQILKRQVSEYSWYPISSSKKQRPVALVTVLPSHKYTPFIFSIMMHKSQVQAKLATPQPCSSVFLSTTNPLISTYNLIHITVVDNNTWHCKQNSSCNDHMQLDSMKNYSFIAPGSEPQLERIYQYFYLNRKLVF